MKRTDSDLRPQAQVFKALGHPARLRMVLALAKGERCVCELHDLVGGDLSTTSKHLAVLTAAGVLASEKRANKVFFSLRTPCVAKVLTCLQSIRSAGPPACCR